VTATVTRHTSIWGQYDRVTVGNVDVSVITTPCTEIRIGTHAIRPNQLLDLIEALHIAFDVLISDGQP